METTKKSPFEILSKVNVNDHVEKKQGLTYLSWAWAWGEVKKAFPDAKYTVYENGNGFPYFTDGKTAWVKTGVTIGDLEHIEYLPILNDAAHASLPLANITSWHVNRAIQRSLTKACARHGLGLYIYAGEDLPDGDGTAAPAAPSRAGNKPQSSDKGNGGVPAEPVIPENLAYHPLATETYWKYVECEARGIPMKSGITAKRSFIKATHAGDKEVQQFLQDVQDFKAGLEAGTIKPTIETN